MEQFVIEAKVEGGKMFLKRSTMAVDSTGPEGIKRVRAGRDVMRRRLMRWQAVEPATRFRLICSNASTDGKRASSSGMR